MRALWPQRSLRGDDAPQWRFTRSEARTMREALGRRGGTLLRADAGVRATGERRTAYAYGAAYPLPRRSSSASTIASAISRFVLRR